MATHQRPADPGKVELHKTVLTIRHASSEEFDLAITLIELNMAPRLRNHDIEWDEAWTRTSYIGKDNYSILNENEWIGFVSLELLEDCLFIHTLQLIPRVQGNIYGVRLLEWMKARAISCNRKKLGCRALKNSSVVGLYGRLGFITTESDNKLVTLSLDLQ